MGFTKEQRIVLKKLKADVQPRYKKFWSYNHTYAATVLLMLQLKYRVTTLQREAFGSSIGRSKGAVTYKISNLQAAVLLLELAKGVLEDAIALLPRFRKKQLPLPPGVTEGCSHMSAIDLEVVRDLQQYDTECMVVGDSVREALRRQKEEKEEQKRLKALAKLLKAEEKKRKYEHDWETAFPYNWCRKCGAIRNKPKSHDYGKCKGRKTTDLRKAEIVKKDDAPTLFDGTEPEKESLFFNKQFPTGAGEVWVCRTGSGTRNQ